MKQKTIEEMLALGRTKKKNSQRLKRYFVYMIDADAWLGRDFTTKEFYLTKDEPLMDFSISQLAQTVFTDSSFWHFLNEFEYVLVQST